MKFQWRLPVAVIPLCAAIWWSAERVSVKSTGTDQLVSQDRRIMEPKRNRASSGDRSASRDDHDGSRNVDAPVSLEDPGSISSPATSVDAVNQQDAMVGIRLARDIRLPATSFAVGPDFFASPEVAMAHQEIENRFYRELLDQTLQSLRASSDPDESSDVTDQIPIDENGEKTVTVQPGPDTDRALDRSDEAFRSLFGNDAYNRRKMDGALELGASNNLSGD